MFLLTYFFLVCKFSSINQSEILRFTLIHYIFCVVHIKQIPSIFFPVAYTLCTIDFNLHSVRQDSFSLWSICKFYLSVDFVPCTIKYTVQYIQMRCCFWPTDQLRNECVGFLLNSGSLRDRNLREWRRPRWRWHKHQSQHIHTRKKYHHILFLPDEA